jgi:hypothetical protein
VAFAIQQSSCYNFFLFRDFSTIFNFVCRRNICENLCAILLNRPGNICTIIIIHRTWFMHHDYTRKLRLSAGKYPTKTKHSIGLTHHLCHNQLVLSLFYLPSRSPWVEFWPVPLYIFKTALISNVSGWTYLWVNDFFSILTMVPLYFWHKLWFY